MIYYIYDKKDNIIGFKYNNDTYYYEKNIQNDVIRIMDNNLNLIVKYEYDAYGNTIKITDNNNNIINDYDNIGIINKIRYRSYYYDSETEYYYLNSRYYSPEIGRFINGDEYVSTAKGLFSSNMYLYSENNPIVRYDDSGDIWFQVAGSFYGALISGVSTISMNMLNDNEWDDGLGASIACGAVSGIIETTPLGIYEKALRISYDIGSAFVESYYSSNNPYEIISNTLTNSLTNIIAEGIADHVYINPNWYRPTTIKTSFLGNYTKRINTNNIYSTVIQNSTQYIATNSTKNIFNKVTPKKNTKKNTKLPELPCLPFKNDLKSINDRLMFWR